MEQQKTWVNPLGVAVDFFTLTVARDSTSRVWAITEEIRRTLLTSYRLSDWRFFGYQGHKFTAHNQGHFAWGFSPYDDMGVIVQASGNLCNRFVDRYLQDEARWSRIDMAVDCEIPEANPNLCGIYYNWIIQNKIHKERKYALIQSSDGGTTLYVGSRSSEEFGRVYDKGEEAALPYAPGHLWRYEIELKGDKAKQAVRSLMSLVGAYKDKQTAISATVYDWFDKRSVPPLFRRATVGGLDLKVQVSDKTDDERLIWLRKQVSPTVKELIMSGNRDVLDALGITEFFTLSRKGGS